MGRGSGNVSGSGLDAVVTCDDNVHTGTESLFLKSSMGKFDLNARPGARFVTLIQLVSEILLIRGTWCCGGVLRPGLGFQAGRAGPSPREGL